MKKSREINPKIKDKIKGIDLKEVAATLTIVKLISDVAVNAKKIKGD